MRPLWSIVFGGESVLGQRHLGLPSWYMFMHDLEVCGYTCGSASWEFRCRYRHLPVTSTGNPRSRANRAGSPVVMAMSMGTTNMNVYAYAFLCAVNDKQIWRDAKIDPLATRAPCS